jgi:hypothetical protein
MFLTVSDRQKIAAISELPQRLSSHPGMARRLRELHNQFVDTEQRKGGHSEHVAQGVQMHDQAEYREHYEKRAKCS